MPKLMLILGSLSAFLAVALGAFGAHGLRGRLTPDLMAIYETAVQYHMIHSLGLILVGLLMRSLAQSTLLAWSGFLILAGIVVFSGSLYLLSITGVRSLGAITPIGGLAFLAGWITLAITVWKSV
jgi:uncharacterized membrane protein YgdD (TMEM256/DUF423 family)